MSLTILLKGKREIDLELQSILREIIPGKQQFSALSKAAAFSSQTSIKAPYHLSNSHQSSIVGTAFDYMARFIVAQTIARNKNSVTADLAAIYGLEIIKRHCDDQTSRLLESKWKEGVDMVHQFVHCSKRSFEELLCYAAYMARLEHIYRTGMPPRDIKGSMSSMLAKEDREITDDLKRLCEVFMASFMVPQIITPESNVVFNPHFGIASRSCGGADADIYIDGTLYDFKTSKQTGYRWKEVAQIFGYYFLHCIAVYLKDASAKLNGCEIKRLAFYKARYGEIEYIDISAMEQKKMEFAAKRIADLLECTVK